MNIGELRNRVTIQESLATRDSFGAEVNTWIDVVNLWVAIEPLRGREYFAAKQVNAEVNTKIRMRFKKGITPKMRVVFGARIFNIQSVIDLDEKHREIELFCTEVI